MKVYMYLIFNFIFCSVMLSTNQLVAQELCCKKWDLAYHTSVDELKQRLEKSKQIVYKSQLYLFDRNLIKTQMYVLYDEDTIETIFIAEYSIKDSIILIGKGQFIESGLPPSPIPINTIQDSTFRLSPQCIDPSKYKILVTIQP